jgi:hypothetical protein
MLKWSRLTYYWTTAQLSFEFLRVWFDPLKISRWYLGLKPLLRESKSKNWASRLHIRAAGSNSWCYPWQVFPRTLRQGKIIACDMDERQSYLPFKVARIGKNIELTLASQNSIGLFGTCSHMSRRQHFLGTGLVKTPWDNVPGRGKGAARVSKSIMRNWSTGCLAEHQQFIGICTLVRKTRSSEAKVIDQTWNWWLSAWRPTLWYALWRTDASYIHLSAMLMFLLTTRNEANFDPKDAPYAWPQL